MIQGRDLPPPAGGFSVMFIYSKQAQTSQGMSTKTHSSKYCLIIVINKKSQKNIEISFLVNNAMHTSMGGPGVSEADTMH